MADNVELPDEVYAILQEHEETNASRLDAISRALVTKRTEAIAARKNSGIEDVWLSAEEAYLGIDDSNRSTFSGARWAKPTTMAGPVTTTGAFKAEEVSSTAYVRLTSRYVDAGAAKLGEILLPADEKAFSFTNEPVPELISALKDTSHAIHGGAPLYRSAPPPAMPAPPAPQVPAMPGTPAPQAPPPPGAPNLGAIPPTPGIPITVKDIAEEAIEQALASAKKAEARIFGWMVKSRFRGETRKVIFDAARIGVGVLKGPFPRNEVSRAFDAPTKTLKIVSKTVPAYEWKDPWNIYPDPACGEDIHNGDHVFEYDQYSAKQLRKLKSSPGYISAAIDKVLADGPTGTSPEAQKPEAKVNKHLYPIWYYYGTMKREDLIIAGGMGQDEKSADDVYAIVTMVNDTVIRATINPLDSGEFPYHSVPWQRRAGHWAGVGVGEQLEMPQRAINAAIRSLFNNAGKSAGSTIVLDRGAITPADKSWALTPDKIFYKATDATADDVRKAFAFFQVPNMGPQLMAIIELCLRLAEESTNIPLVTQGQSGPTTPDTFGATQLQNNNANQLLRSIGYAFDDYITEPVVLQSYEYLLLDPEVPTDEKGDWHIDAHGSVTLVERAIQDQTVQQMGQFAINPAFGVDPKKWFAEFSKTKHLNPRNFQFTPEQQAKMDATPPPPPPAVQVAQIKSADAKAALAANEQEAAQQAQLQQMLDKADAQVKLQIASWRKEVDELRIQKDADRNTEYVQAQTAQTQMQDEQGRRDTDAQIQLAIMEYTNKNNLKLMEVKAQLADTAQRLAVQKQLAAMGHNVDLTKHFNPEPPPVQVPGKAPNGKAFAQV